MTTTTEIITLKQMTRKLDDCSRAHDNCKDCRAKQACVTLWDNTFSKQDTAPIRIVARFKTIMRRSS